MSDYDREMFTHSLAKFVAYAEPIARVARFEIVTLDVSDLFFGYGEKLQILHKGRNLLEERGCAYVSYANPHPQTERLLHSLARVVASSSDWALVNGSPETLHLDKDKERAFAFARLVGAQTIPTYIVPHRTVSRAYVETMEDSLGPYPYILKPASMLAGLGILKVANREALYSLLDYCAQSPHVYLLQPFLPNAADCRIYLEQGEIIACQRRKPPTGGFLANISQMGTGEAITPDPTVERYSKALAQHLTSHYLCIDWLITDDGIYFSELDFGGLFMGLPEPARTDVATAFFRSARSKVDALEKYSALSFV